MRNTSDAPSRKSLCIVVAFMIAVSSAFLFSCTFSLSSGGIQRELVENNWSIMLMEDEDGTGGVAPAYIVFDREGTGAMSNAMNGNKLTDPLVFEYKIISENEVRVMFTDFEIDAYMDLVIEEKNSEQIKGKCLRNGDMKDTGRFVLMKEKASVA